jgi:DNA polymerase-3 subunit delta'
VLSVSAIGVTIAGQAHILKRIAHYHLTLTLNTHNMKTTNKKDINSIPTIPHPKSTDIFIGHEAAVATLTKIINSEKLPQSWLFSGPKGIGKATLAYRFTRALLANLGANMFGEKELEVPRSHAVFSKIIAGSHSDLLVIEPDSESASKEIKVDDIRKINDFLRLTASQTKYRIVIIDSADDMNTNAANALLKLLEEPPSNALFLLISHAPGKLLPTIKSRCRNLRMSPLSPLHAASVLNYAAPDIPQNEANLLTRLSDGSAGIAAELYYNDGIAIYNAITEILLTAPRINAAKVQGLSNLVTKKDDKAAWDTMVYLLDGLLVRIIRSNVVANNDFETNNIEIQLKNKLIVEKSLEELIKTWDKFKSLVADTDRINLDKKAVIISIFEEFKF